MTSRQRELARRALGLPTLSGKSYRNRYYVGPWHPDFVEWSAMIESGEAKCEPSHSGDPLSATGLVHFWLTPAGAPAALDPGEELDREDFPMEAARG